MIPDSKKLLTLLFLIFSGLLQAQEKDMAASLKEFEEFVDKAYKAREEWFNAGNDTTLIETPTDPKDPTIVRVDTIVLTREKKMQSPNEWPLYLSVYLPRFEEMVQSLSKRPREMDLKMREKFEEQKRRFESITLPVKDKK